MSREPSRARRLTWTARMAADAPRQARFPFRPYAEIRRAQERRVRAAVRHARDHVPYYRETMRRLGLKAADIRTAADLSRLPPLGRGDLQRDPEYFVSDAWPPDGCVAMSSGGSTGAPIQVFRDPPSFLAEAAHRERQRVVVKGLASPRRVLREAVITPPDSSLSTALAVVRGQSLVRPGIRARRRILSMLDAPDAVLTELEAFRPHVVRGYGSYLEALLLELLGRERPSWVPRVASYSADALTDQVRELARDQLGIRAVASYNAIEMPQIAFECEHGGLHLNVDLCPLRLVSGDGGEVERGESGEVVVSNLVARGTVLLNYRLGDLATASGEPCSCGRNLPLLSGLHGRTNQWLELGDGRRLHPQAIMLLLRRDRAVARYQVVQEAPRRLRLRVVPAPDCGDGPAAVKRLAATLRAQLDGDLAVESELVSDLPRSSAGKVQPVVALSRP